MATRFYLTATFDTLLTPAFDTAWDINTSADRRLMIAWKSGSTIASKTSAASGTTSPRSILNRQYHSGKLKAQTISGNFKAQVRGNISSVAAGTTGNPAISVRVFSGDGTTLRATLYTNVATGAGTNYTATLTNRQHPASVALTNYTCVDGDILVVEIGWRFLTGSTSRTVVQSFGNTAATDLAEDNTTTAANNPWIEFSEDLEFYQSSTNLLSNTTNFTTFPPYAQQDITASLNQTIAPDGTNTGAKALETATTAFHQLAGQFTEINNTFITVQVYVKQLNLTTMLIQQRTNAGNTPVATITFSSGTLDAGSSVHNAKIQNVGGGWFRVWHTFYNSQGATTPDITLITPGGSHLGTVTEGFYFWQPTVVEGVDPLVLHPPTGRLLALLGVG